MIRNTSHNRPGVTPIDDWEGKKVFLRRPKTLATYNTGRFALKISVGNRQVPPVIWSIDRRPDGSTTRIPDNFHI